MFGNHVYQFDAHTMAERTALRKASERRKNNLVVNLQSATDLVPQFRERVILSKPIIAASSTSLQFALLENKSQELP
jgi:hypothetical protein